MAWILTCGPIPGGLWVLHRCDARYPVGDTTYRRCVNPAHLFLGTHADNMADMATKGRAKPFVSEGERRGEHNPNARLTAQQAAAVPALLRLGLRRATLAEMFGVSEHTIGAIARGKTWRGPTPEGPS